MPTVYKLCLWGKVPSTKNRYTVRKGGKGLTKDRKLQGELDALAIQIPGYLRDLKLVHPDLDFYFSVPKNSGRERPEQADSDGKMTTLLDRMVLYGVLKDDSIAWCNGRKTIHPVTVGLKHYTEVVITCKAETRNSSGNA